ncbi:GrlR family regulatory protein [Citrobacter cronae]|uniref:GrlR family regulatory protein n=1 Tax=Citrobacter cronae TaxID=1748967 RepID=UPI001C1224FA|nr:GrlR family regulatory protein [Citrobacter cronae]MBU5388664.1 hypothetical protein [Citrobacter cronae]
MKDGVYHVAFTSNQGAVGEGILVLCCGLINGGDIGFIYQGKLSRPEMTLRITRYYDDIPSVLGIDNDYELEMVIQNSNETDGQYILHGFAREYPQLTIEAHARFLVPVPKSDHA